MRHDLAAEVLARQPRVIDLDARQIRAVGLQLEGHLPGDIGLDDDRHLLGPGVLDEVVNLVHHQDAGQGREIGTEPGGVINREPGDENQVTVVELVPSLDRLGRGHLVVLHHLRDTAIDGRLGWSRHGGRLDDEHVLELERGDQHVQHASPALGIVIREVALDQTHLPGAPVLGQHPATAIADHTARCGKDVLFGDVFLRIALVRFALGELHIPKTRRQRRERRDNPGLGDEHAARKEDMVGALGSAATPTPLLLTGRVILHAFATSHGEHP